MRVYHADLLMYAGDAHPIGRPLESSDAEPQVAASSDRSSASVRCLAMRKQATSSSFLVTVVSLGGVRGEVSANFERPSRSHFSLDSRKQANLV